MARSREVNDMLRNLRGEQFRQSQNKRKSRTHVSSSTTFARNSPSLPLEVISLSLDLDPTTGTFKIAEKADSSTSTTFSKYSGPAPPKSWSSTRASEDVGSGLIWRRRALSLIFRGWKPLSELVLPLTLICLSQVLSYTTTPEFVDEVVPCIPPHLRVELLRYSAIFNPLCNARLSSMIGAEGHVEGELIVVGPNASLSEEHFLHVTPGLRSFPQHDWDSDDPVPNPLRLFALVLTKLATSTLLTLPPTITHMALIKLPTPIPLHRLPLVCPLLEVLDLSYNTWLCPPSDEMLKSLERLDWARWRHLQVLGIRECFMPEETIVSVNRGRWDDVELIQ
ncbi:hypothetical protein E1B28_008911 [Marasmius oreades]|uniref:Uncharacterized protein n=1 Tax=Marasmius oreades TaxID=181124 RepID=A0A9P7RZI1_9AGAR|nr:uncharacterized protein E1B28_008911 [Marasmius oreades]KAG7092562.1 hypothetical protein E1B28_008911 [Marasmius oreades]